MAYEFQAPGHHASGAGVGAAVDPQVFQQAHFRSLSVPDRVIAGELFNVTGVLHWDLFGVNNIECRAVASPSWTNDRRDNVGKLDHCQTATFSIPLRAPDQPGQTVELAMKAQNNPPLSDWETNELETFQIEVLTGAQKAAQNAVEFAPWVVGGGAAGFALSEVSQEFPRRQTTAAGVGAGAVGKVVWDRVSQEVRQFEVPFVELAAITAFLASAGFLVNEVTGIFEA